MRLARCFVDAAPRRQLRCPIRCCWTTSDLRVFRCMVRRGAEPYKWTAAEESPMAEVRITIQCPKCKSFNVTSPGRITMSRRKRLGVFIVLGLRKQSVRNLRIIGRANCSGNSSFSATTTFDYDSVRREAQSNPFLSSFSGTFCRQISFLIYQRQFRPK